MSSLMYCWLCYLGLFFCLASCGYRSCYEGFSLQGKTISVPYISGDNDALLHRELAYQIGASGFFQFVQTRGDYILRVEIVSDKYDRIGFRYDRDNPKGVLEKNLLGVENRRSITALCSLVKAESDHTVIGPITVSADVDYDYTDPGSPRDLEFTRRESTMEFSLGQLTSEEGGDDGSSCLLFRKLSHQIIFSLFQLLE